MSTFILNPNDTIVLNDSIIVKVTEATAACQPVETNCSDVCIVALICLAFIVVAWIAKCAICSWQKANIDFKKREFDDKRTKEKEESERKQKAEEKNRTWQHEDQERKQKNDLLERRLNILKARCYELKTFEETKDDKNVKIVKEVLRSNCDDEIKNYISALEKAFENTPTDKTAEPHE